MLDVRRDLAVAKAGLLVGYGQYGEIAVVWIYVYLLCIIIIRKNVRMLVPKMTCKSP